MSLAPETIRSKKKVGFIFHPSFYVPVHCTVGSGMKTFGSWILRNEKFWDPDPG
jgi:hypothetical protein